MEFSHKQVFIYDQSRRAKFEFSEVLKAYENRSGRIPSQFALSGLDDLVNAMHIIEEYYSRNFAHVDFKELRRGIGLEPVVVDHLYNEPAALRREFSRVIPIPVFVNQEDKVTKLAKQGAQTNHVVEFCTGMITLYRANYFPEIGDEVVWLGSLYHIGEVVYKRDHLHQNTGFPLHVTLKCVIQQWGDEQFPSSLTSKNSVSHSPGEGRPQAKNQIGHRIPVIKFDK